MGFFDWLSNIFSTQGSGNASMLPVAVRCNRCGEILRTKVNLNNDLSAVFGEAEGDLTYFCRKMLVGSRGCFERVEVELTFNRDRVLLNQEIKGGKFVESG
jgi:hypothetical protein